MTRAERLSAPYRMQDLEFSIEKAQRLKPDFILVSDYERQHCVDWAIYAGRCAGFLNWLDSGESYRPVQRFPREVGWKSWRWKRPENSPAFDDDLWITTLTLYERTR